MKLKIKLIKSKIGKLDKHKRIIQSLGLRKLSQIVIKEDTPIIQGMVKKIDYMLQVEKIDDT